MYVTRPLSLLRRSPELLNIDPKEEGPNLGYAVLFDEECDRIQTSNRNRRSRTSIEALPFPQNKSLISTYRESDFEYYQGLVFIPVLDQPLSSNLYYVIDLSGNNIGEAYTSSKEEDKRTSCWCCTYIKGVKRHFDPSDIYQQFKVHPQKYDTFSVTSKTSDGYPPYGLRNKSLTFQMGKTLSIYHIGEALGLDSSLRARLPALGQAAVIGKWCCPFIFVKEENMSLKKQVCSSMFYEMTLEQRWEMICEYTNKRVGDREKAAVKIDVMVENEEVFVGGERGVCEEGNSENGVIWFKSSCDGELEGKITKRLGLSMKIVERMKWEQQRFGWVGLGGNEKQVRVEKREEFEGGWTKFGCYVLVERFVLRRANKSVALAYDFKHTHHIRCSLDFDLSSN